METQKIVNLLNSSDNEDSKFTTKKWYVIDSESKSNYSRSSLVRMSESRFLKRRYVENQIPPLVLFLISRITAEAL